MFKSLTILNRISLGIFLKQYFLYGVNYTD